MEEEGIEFYVRATSPNNAISNAHKHVWRKSHFKKKLRRILVLNRVDEHKWFVRGLIGPRIRKRYS